MDNNIILNLYLNIHETQIIQEVNECKESKGVGLLVVDVTNITRSHGWSCNTNTTYYTIDEMPGSYFTYKEQISSDPEQNTSVYFLMNLGGNHTFYKRPQTN